MAGSVSWRPVLMMDDKTELGPIQPPIAVLFDLDGTLLDNSEVVVDAYYQGMQELGYEPASRQEIALQAGKSTIETARSLGLEEKDWSGLDTYFWQYFGDYAHQDDLQVELISPVVPILELLSDHKIPLGVVTSNTASNAEALLQHARALHYFDTVVGKEFTDKHKPDPEPLQYALQQLSVTADPRVWMVGDSAADVGAAQAAGLTAVAIPQAHTLQSVIAQEPELVLQSMHELYQLFQQVFTTTLS